MDKKADVYTRTGDEGMTGLLGGSRVAKDSPQVSAKVIVVNQINLHPKCIFIHTQDRTDSPGTKGSLAADRTIQHDGEVE